MAPSGLGQIGLRLKLGGPALPAAPSRPLPEGKGPLLVLWTSPGSQAAAEQITAIVQQSRPDLRLFDLTGPDMPDPARDSAAMEWLAMTAPAAVLLLGTDLPPALIMAASKHSIPIFLGDARFEAPAAHWGLGAQWGLGASMRRELLGRIRMMHVIGADSVRNALRMNIPRHRIRQTGPVTPPLEPPGCPEAERAAIAELLKGRHTWLAAGIPPSEESAVLTAHGAALRKSHRALLLLAPSDPARVPALARRIEAGGLIVARRDLDEEPTDEVQVMLTDGPTEMGLWYRLAPVTFIGGTLMGAGSAHPFEAAALGSAIVHGPHIAAQSEIWQQLDQAGAARRVLGTSELASTMAELTQPDLIASMAHNAWTICTEGAGIALRIATPILAALPGARP